MTRITSLLSFLCLALTTLLALAGCGAGASATPTVTYKSGGGEAESGGGPVVAIDGVGTLTGTITLTGTAPTPQQIIARGAAQRDPSVCAADTAILDQSLKVGDGNGIANVFVYIDKAPAGAAIPEPPTEPAVFDQKGCVFIPHAMVVRTNQKILIKSQDNAGHNTHTYPKRSRTFNGAIKALEKEGVPLFYNKHEKLPFQVKCDMHAWMQAYHLALDHPWGTITNANGTFEIKDVPATEVTLRIWHEKAGGKGGYLQRSLKVTIPKDGTATQDLTFSLSDFGL